ncbi:MAG: hypothetical protein ACOCYB_02935, partial [Alkalispirochaeta sp.]
MTVSLIVAPRRDFDVTSQRLTSDLRDEGLLHRDESVRVLRRYQVSDGATAGEGRSSGGTTAGPGRSARADRPA